MQQPGLREVCTLHVTLGSISEMGTGRGGQRRIIPITGGYVDGTLAGTIRSLGADWQTVYADGTAWLDTRYAFDTNDGALIEIVNRGFRHGPSAVMDRLAAGEDISPEDYYFRTFAMLETGDARYDWVNRTVFIGKGCRRPTSVEVALYAIT